MPPSSRIGTQYQLDLLATDALGAQTRVPLRVSVVADAPPQVAILSPVTQAVITAGSLLTFSATAIDDGGPVTGVRWTVDGLAVGASSSAPYSVQWRVPVSLSGRPIVVGVDATDTAGNVGHAQVTISAVPDTNRPTASLLSPPRDAKITSSQSLTVTAGAQDDVDVQRVEFFLDGTKVFTELAPSPVPAQPGAVSAHAVLPPSLFTPGAHRLSARAYDTAGNVGVAPEVSITVQGDQPPEVSFLLPAAGSHHAVGTRLSVSARAVDDVAVSKVELKLDGTVVGTRQLAPYLFELQLSGAPRTATLELVATDSAGVTASATRSVVLEPDTEKPLVGFRTPLPAARVFVGRPLVVELSATDNVALQQATLSLNGGTAQTQTQSTLDGLYRVFTFNTAVPQAQGSLALRATATDTAGNTAEKEITLQVSADQPPVVTVDGPATGASYREGAEVTVTATVTDDDGVIAVGGRAADAGVDRLATTGPRLNISERFNVKVRAPSISRGAPPLVGFQARDTAQQIGFADVPLLVIPDTEAPVMTVAQPSSSDGGIDLGRGGWLALRVESEDDVWVAKATARLTSLDAGADLTTINGRLQQTQVPDPSQPGAIITQERYYATWTGDLDLRAQPAGDYPLELQVEDGAGNAATTRLTVHITPFVDTQVPALELLLLGTPAGNTCVEGSTITLRANGSDDGQLAQLSLEQDNTPLGAYPTGGYSSFSKSVQVTMPRLETDADGLVFFSGSLTDSAGHTGEASLACVLAPDAAPEVALNSPVVGAAWTEWKPERARVTTLDDVGLNSSLIAVGNAAAQASDGGLDLPGFTGAANFTVVTANQRFRFEFGGGRAHVHNEVLSVPQATQITLPAGAQMTVRPRMGIASGSESVGTALSFVQQYPNGQRQVTTDGSSFTFSPPASVSVTDTRFDVSLNGTLFSVGIDHTQHGLVWLEQGASHAALRPLGAVSAPNRSVETPLDFRVPRQWLGNQTITAGVCDTGNQCRSASRVISLRPDLTPPRSTALSPAQVVVNRPYEVRAIASDEVDVIKLELLVDGVLVSTKQGVMLGQHVFRLTAPPTPSVTPLRIVVRATDASGNATESEQRYTTVVEDAGPDIALQSLSNAFEHISQLELQSGLVRLLEGQPSHLQWAASDDVHVSRVTARLDGVVIFNQQHLAPPFLPSLGTTTTFTPPIGAGTSVLELEAEDDLGHVAKRRLIVESRGAQAPIVALISPSGGTPIASGSINLRFEAIAADDIGVASIDFRVNGQIALSVPTTQGRAIDTSGMDSEGVPLASDPAIRAAVAAFDDGWRDVTRFRRYAGQVAVPAGLLQAGTTNAVRVSVTATDLESHTSSDETTLTVVPDTTKPVATLCPGAQNLCASGQQLTSTIEGTLLRISTVAHDNVFVESVEVLAGPSQSQLTTVFRAGGFDPINAVVGSSFEVFAPPQSFEFSLPRICELPGRTCVPGMVEMNSAPYFVAIRARDASGNVSDVFEKAIELLPDQPPSISIQRPNPTAGDFAVAGHFVDVSMLPVDDVAITSVMLLVDDDGDLGTPATPFPVVRQNPPFAFRVPAPSNVPFMTFQARAVDSAGHETMSAAVQVTVRTDAPPTISITRPLDGAALTEGRYAVVNAAAADDIGVSQVAFTVTGLNGTVTFSDTTPPYQIELPLPYGSAGKTVTVTAAATGSGGVTVASAPISFTVVPDTGLPSVSFISPAQTSQMRPGGGVPIDIRAEDDTAIASVVLRLDRGDGGVPLATLASAPYRFTLPVPADSVGETWTLSALARDTSGNQATAQVSLQIIADAPPTVALLSDATVTAGQRVNLNATAADDVAISRVDFFMGLSLDGGVPERAELASAGSRYVLPYQQPLTVPREWVGRRAWAWAKAFDTAAQTAESALISFQVTADTPPTSVIARPVTGSFVGEGRVVTIDVDASDAEGPLTQVVFLVDGQRVDAASTPAGIPGFASRYRGRWVPPVGSGNRIFVITAVAIDSSGQETVSQPVSVGSVTDTVPPTAEIIDPAAWDVVTEATTVNINAVAEDNAAIANVVMFDEGTEVGTATVPGVSSSSRPMYTVPWLIPNTPGAMRSLTAVAKDAAGNTTSATAVKVEVGMQPEVTTTLSMAGQPPLETTAFAARRDGLFARAWASQSSSDVMLARDAETAAVLQGRVQVQWPASNQTVRRFTALAFTEPVPTTPASVTGLLVGVIEQTLSSFPELVVIDVRSPTTPQVLGRVSLPSGEVGGITLRGHLAYVALGSSGIATVDLTTPNAPQRLATTPVVGSARDVVAADRLLLVASDVGGLRVLDLTQPGLDELGFVALPGAARRVVAQGQRAFVSCEFNGGPIATVDVSTPSAPALLSLSPQNIARRDVLMSDAPDIAVSGQLLLSAAALRAQDAQPVKGLLTVDSLSAQGVATPFVRANVHEGPSSSRRLHVGFSPQGPLSTYDDYRIVRFTPPRLAVVDSTPLPLARQVSPSADLVLTFNAEPDAAELAQALSMRAADSSVGLAIGFTALINGTEVTITPDQALPLGERVYLRVTPPLHAVAGAPLVSPYELEFKTAVSANPPPHLASIAPQQGPVSGGTQVTVHGSDFKQGARLFFGTQEATQVTRVDAQTLTAVTPANLEGAAFVTVVNPDGLEDAVPGAFVYVPVLGTSLVQPATGPLAGGTRVSIIGSGYQRGATVRFDGVAATDVVVKALGTIEVTTPPGSFGPADVEVQNPDGRISRLEGGFVYSELSLTGAIAKYTPSSDGQTRPAEKLGRTDIIDIDFAGGRGVVLQAANINTGLTPAEVLDRSVLGTIALVALDGGTPTLLGGTNFLPPYAPRGVARVGSRAYVSLQGADLPGVEMVGEGQPALAVVDFTNPYAPVVGTITPFIGNAGEVAVLGDLLVVASGLEGLTSFSLVDPDRPVLLGAQRVRQLNGAFFTDPIVRVRTSHGHFVATGAPQFAAPVSFVEDPSRPVFATVAEFTGTTAELRGDDGLTMTTEAGRSLEARPLSNVRLATTIPSLLPGNGFEAMAIGPHLGVYGLSGASGGFQIVSTGEPGATRTVTVADAWPVKAFSDVAIDGDRFIAGTRVIFDANQRTPAQDGLVVARAPFPMVVGMVPAIDRVGVPVTTQVEVTFNEPIINLSPSTVRFTKDDGSATGVDVANTLTFNDNTLHIAPTAALEVSTTYRLRIDGLASSSTGAPLPAPFITSFTTASAVTAREMTLSALTPREGPVAGGTVVTLTGTGFVAGSEVRVATQLGTVQSVASDGTQLTFVTPPGVAGLARLQVTSPQGTQLVRDGAYLYIEPLQATAITPSRGPSAGGTWVTVTGRGFATAGAVRVQFGGNDATAVRVLGTGRLEASTPAGAIGRHDVRVVNPDGSASTLSLAWEYEQPSASNVRLTGDVHEILIVGQIAYLAGNAGMTMVDLSGLERAGANVGQPIPVAERNGFIDRDGNGRDDRIMAIGGGGIGTALSRPAEGGSRFWMSRAAYDPRSGKWTGGIEALDVSLVHQGLSDVASIASGGGANLPLGAFGVARQGDQVLAAERAFGVRRYDATGALYEVGTVPLADGGAQGLVSGEGFALAVRGERHPTTWQTSNTALVRIDTRGAMSVTGELALEVNRVRLRGTTAVVAAGSQGLVLVDAAATPMQIVSTLDVGGVARDVTLAGDLAYVAVENVGVVIVDVSNPLLPTIVHGVAGGGATAVSVGSGLLVSARVTPSGVSLSFGPVSDFFVVSTSAQSGDTVPLDVPSLSVVFSTQINTATVAANVSVTANGQPLPGTLETVGGTLTFKPSALLPANADIVFEVGAGLRSAGGAPLLRAMSLRLRSAAGVGPRPRLSLVSPRAGLTAGGEEIELLGVDFDASASVTIGGAPAQVIASGATRLRVITPAGNEGLADVVVTNGVSGLSVRRPGGFLYRLPFRIDLATPAFLNPRGGSVVTLRGQGLLPAWLEPGAPMRVRIGGLETATASVVNGALATVTAPANSFGEVLVQVVHPDGNTITTLPVPLHYGLPWAAEEKTLGMAPQSLIPDPTTPGVLHAAAGNSGTNRFEQPYFGPLTGNGSVKESFRFASFDVTRAGSPRLQGVVPVEISYALADRVMDAVRRSQAIPEEAELMPDSLDVVYDQGRLLIANGESGAALMQGGGDGGITGLFIELKGRQPSRGAPTTRVVPLGSGLWSLNTSFTPLPAPPGGCASVLEAVSNGGSISLVDARTAADPLSVRTINTSEAPTGAVMWRERLVAVTGHRTGVKYNRCGAAPPSPPDWSSRAPRTDFTIREPGVPTDPSGTLFIYDAVASVPTLVGSLALPSSLNDVVVVDDVAIVAAYPPALLFIDLADPANPTEIARIPFDATLSNTPGVPERLRVFGNLLFVAAGSGGPVLVDISDLAAPRVISAGNDESARDVLPAEERLYTATGTDRGVIEYAMPFSVVRGVAPARNAIVPPSAAPIIVSLSRPISEPSVTNGSVWLETSSGQVPVTLTVNNDFVRHAFELVLTPLAPLSPSTRFTVRTTTAIADQRGGGLLLPFSSSFDTAPAGARQPALFAAQPAWLPTTGGTLTVTGTELSGIAAAHLAGDAVAFTVTSNTEVSITVPARTAGYATLVVTDQSGLTASLPIAVQVADPLSGPVTLSTDHGPVAGGTRVKLTLTNRAALPSGSRVYVDGVLAHAIDVESTSVVSFTTPAAYQPGLVSIAVERPGEAPAHVATYSYEGELGETMNLPGFPPRVPSELELVGTTLFMGSSRNPAGLEAFDVIVPERPIRLGGQQTASPVRGLDVEGTLAFLALDGLGISVVDVTTPTVPYEVAHATTSGLVTDVEVVGNELWASITNPEAFTGRIWKLSAQGPVFGSMGDVPLNADPTSFSVSDGRLFALATQVTTSGGTASATDLTLREYDPTTGAQRSSTLVVSGTDSYENRVRSRVAVRAGRAYVTLSNRVYVYDVSGATPSLIRTAQLPDVTTGVSFSGANVLVGTLNGSTTVQTLPAVELEVTRLQPTNGSVVTADSTIVAELNLPVASLSVTASTFRVTSGNTEIPGTFSTQLTLRGANVIFTPTSALPAGTIVVRVDGLKTEDQRPLVVPAETTFTVSADTLAQQPRIASLSPAFGFADSTTTAVISGTGFRSGDVVHLGAQQATVLATSATSLTIEVPPAPQFQPGPVAVSVTDPGGPSATRAGGFVYRERPRLVSLTPDTGPQAGGNTVTLTGRGFAPGLTVDFDSTRSFLTTVLTTNTAIAVAPPHTQGRVGVTVGVSGGSFTLPDSYLYGSGAVAQYRSGAVSDLVVEGSAAWAAIGGSTRVVGSDGTVYDTERTTDSNGVLVLDVSDPNAIVTVKTVPIAAQVRRLARFDSTKLLAATSIGLVEIDTTLPALSAVSRTLALSGDARDVVVANALAFVADDAGVAVVDLQRFILAGRISVQGGASALALHEGELVVGTRGSALHLYDVRNGAFTKLGEQPLAGTARHLTVSGHRVFASLGSTGQVAIVNVTVPTSPAPAGSLQLNDALGAGWVSAERTLVSGDTVYVAAGGGDVQRFTARLGQPSQWVDTAQVFGDVRALALHKRNLFAGTLFLQDGNGPAVELPVHSPADAAGAVKGAVATIALDYATLTNALPTQDGRALLADVLQVSMSELPASATMSALTLSTATGTNVPITRQLSATTDGATLTLRPDAPLSPSTRYTMTASPTLAGLSGASLGVQWTSTFDTASSSQTFRPRVGGLTPSAGLTGGGDSVIVHGEDLVNGSLVRVGGVAAAVTAVSADGRQLTITVPAGAPGFAVIEVTAPNSMRTRVFGAYRYLQAPSVSLVSPLAAPIDSRTAVRIEGQGLHDGSVVKFGALPAASVALNNDGSLTALTPDGIVGPAVVSVETMSPAGPVSAQAPASFTFTLSRDMSVAEGLGPSARIGDVLLATQGADLVPFDVSIPTQPLRMTPVAGVAQPGAITIVGHEAFVAGYGQVVRYELGSCGSGPANACAPQEVQRLTFPVGAQFTSIVAQPGAAYVALLNSSELVLLGLVNGQYEPVASTTIGSGAARALAFDGGRLFVLIDGGGQSRLEIRDATTAILPLVGEVVGLPAGASALALEHTRLAIACGGTVALADVSQPSSPVIVATWVAPSFAPHTLTLDGPWLLAGSNGRVWLLDSTQGLTARTWADTQGSSTLVTLFDGELLVASSAALQAFDFPYASVTAVPRRIAPGSPLQVALPSPTPLSVLNGSNLAVSIAGTPRPGTLAVQGGTLVFTPTAPFAAGDRLDATLTTPSFPAVGSTWSAPFRFSVEVTTPAAGLVASSLTPTYGPSSGNTVVTITGANFTGNTQVRFGGALATVVSSTFSELQVRTPSSAAPGPVQVEVTDGAEVTTVPGGFTYLSPLSFSAITPSVFSESGGPARITGTGFTRALRVLLDGVPMNVTSFSPTFVDLTVPAGPVAQLTLELQQPSVAPVVVPNAVRRADQAAPSLVSLAPVDQVGQNNVPHDAVFTAVFNEALAPASVSTTTVSLRTASGTSVAITVALGGDGKSIVITPTALLTSTTQYTLYFSGITDLAGNATTAARGFRARDTEPPTVNLVLEPGARALNDGAQFASGVPWSIRVVVTDDSGQVTGATLAVDGQPVVPSSNGLFQYTWPASAIGQTSVLTATGTDNAGLSRTKQVTVSINNDAPPVVAIIAPQNNQTVVEGSSLAMNVEASDNNGLSLVRLSVNGRPWATKTITSGDSTTSLSDTYRIPTNAGGSTITLAAEAVDSVGTPGFASPVTVNVVADTTAPTVSVLSPAVNTRLRASVPVVVRGQAVDTGGVSTVIFRAGGVEFARVNGSPWQATWTRRA